MIKKYIIDELKNIKIDINIPTIIFLKGDLGAGKTTLSKHIINNLLGYKLEITSPTYTYYNKYTLEIGDFGLDKTKKNNSKLQTQNSKLIIYHFDLYRLKNYDEFFSIGGEEILDNNNGVIIVEWPEIIEKYYKADIVIQLNRTKNENEREIDIIKR